MKRSIGVTLGAVVLASAFAAPASARIRIVIPIEIIATTTPVYYEGRASYWYDGRWYYRTGGDWYEYREEPVYLRDYRLHHDYERHYYGGRREWRERERARERARWREERREREREEREDREERHRRW